MSTTVCMGVVTVTTVGKGAEHERERQKRLLHMALANKHRCILGKDLCHRKWILLRLRSVRRIPCSCCASLRSLYFSPLSLRLADLTSEGGTNSVGGKNEML